MMHVESRPLSVLVDITWITKTQMSNVQLQKQTSRTQILDTIIVQDL